MSEPRKFEGIWIPADLWLDRRISVMEKVFLIEIKSLDSTPRGCYKSNQAFAEFFDLSKSRVSEIVNRLAEKGLINIVLVRKGKQVIERRIYFIEKPVGGVFGMSNTPIRNSRIGVVGKDGDPYSENAEERDNNKSNTDRDTSLSEQGSNDESCADDPIPKPQGKTKKSGTEEDHKAAHWIFDRVKSLGGSPKDPNWKTWANDIRLMREQDGRTHREICELFAWANRDDFWRVNILSPSKLRKQWEQLAVKRLSQLAPKPAAKSDKFDPLAHINQHRPDHHDRNHQDHTIDGYAVRVD